MLSFLELLKTTVTIFKLYKSPCSLHQCFKPWPVFAWLYEKVVCFLNGWKYCVLFWKNETSKMISKSCLCLFQWLKTWLAFVLGYKTQLVFVSTIKILASIYIRDWKHLWYLSKFINCKYRTFWWLLSLGGDIFWMLEQI